MKIEAEVEPSVYAFSVAEGQGGGGGCSANGAERTPTAQERSSIDRPEWQPPGCGGCGPASSSDNVGPTSVFDCEHFQFIDEDDEEGVSSENVCPATQTPAGQDSNAASAPNERSAEVSQRQQQQTHDRREMGESESAARARSHAVKRQVSFDEVGSNSPSTGKREIKTVLKKANRANKKQLNRVTFDEAVTLYSDENEDVQMLALTTGPDIVYTDVYYMFDPPIEYQDVPPFEPPAEYRDSDEVGVQTSMPPPPPAAAAPVDTLSDTAEQTVPENDQPEKQTQCESCAIDPIVTNKSDNPIQEHLKSIEINSSDVAVSKETEKTDSATDENATKPTECQQVSECTLESDKLFERFLEAEREFAVDEELNSVFRALENDFANDDKNGALDDNFFRKLISLLSSAEGETTNVSIEGNDFFSETNLVKSQLDLGRETEDDDNSQTHSRTLSEADSDCSISSQDTIIVRFGEDDTDQNSSESNSLYIKPIDTDNKDVPDNNSSDLPSDKSECYDEVFTEISESASSSDEKPKPLPRESLLIKNNHVAQVVAKIENANGESLSRQSSGEQSVNSANSQDHPQDADDSTSSDSRSGEVEEEIRLDDIGYDEEDAEDYDEESFRGMAHGSSKIRRIIKKNALQCTLFRGIEAKRRQQPGAKYPRPKSPLLSQESLVEKLKWLTTIDEHKDADGPIKFHSKPPDVILSTGGIPVNGSIPHSASSEDDISSQSAQGYPPFYQVQQRLPPNSQQGYYIRHDEFPPTHHPSLPRQRVAFSGHPSQMMHTLPYSQNRVVAHPSASQQMQWSEQQRPMSSMTVPRNFRDWRVIQRVTGNRGNEGNPRGSQVAADYVRCPNGSISAYPVNVLPDVSRTSQTPLSKDELEQFVEKDSKRLEMIRKRYSVAEEEDDPTFGFARRPSVKGVQKQIQSKPSESVQGHGTNKVDPYPIFEEHVQGPALVHPRSPYANEQVRIWSRDPNWRPDNILPHSQLYGPPTQGGRSQVPMHIHRASVALTELPGNATIPYTHRNKPHLDVRYHSYAESMYGSTRTLPTKGWMPPDPRTCHVPNPVAAHQTLPISNIPLPAVSPPMLQVPPHSVAAKDERGVPEGASSSPKISSDSLYHAPVPDAIATGGPHKEDGMIYYSLNV